MATSAGDVQSHTEFTTSAAQYLSDAHAAHQAGEMAAQQRQDHYLSNVSGLGAAAGDLAPAPSTQMPDSPPPPDRSTT